MIVEFVYIKRYDFQLLVHPLFGYVYQIGTKRHFVMYTKAGIFVHIEEFHVSKIVKIPFGRLN